MIRSLFVVGRLAVGLLGVAAATEAYAQASSSTCESLKTRGRAPQSSLGAASAFLKENYAGWNADVSGTVDPRSRDKWPGRFDGPDCAVLANNQIVVPGTSCEKVHSLLVDAPKWDTIYPNVADVSLDAPPPLKEKAEFGFRTFGSDQTCKVEEATAARVSWTCTNTLGLGHIHHRWNCTQDGTGVLVSTQECQNGFAFRVLSWLDSIGTPMKDTMQRGHQAWLEALKCKLADPSFALPPATR